MEQLMGRCCASVPSAALAGWQEQGTHPLCLRAQDAGTAAQNLARELEEKECCVQFLKLFQAPVRAVFSLAPTAPSAKTTEAGGV